MPKSNPAVSAYIVIILFGTISCLKIVGINVPTLADQRQPASLVCNYDLGDEALFSVKWYKDDHEFFRYMPANKPNVLLFPLPGISVKPSDEEACSDNNCEIKLVNLLPTASGTYTCEVSTEAPTFGTTFESKNMTVAALPLEKPKIEGLRSSYAIGELLELTCRTAPSAPPSTPNFFVNDAEIEEKYIDRSTVLDEENMVISTAKLKLVLSKGHFLGGALLRVRCTAALVTIPAVSHSTFLTAALADTQALRNQKLKWANGSSSHLEWSPLLMAFAVALVYY